MQHERQSFRTGRMLVWEQNGAPTTTLNFPPWRRRHSCGTFFFPQKLRAHPIVCCSQHVEITPTTNTTAQTYYFGINQVFFKPGSEWMAEWSSDSILCGEQIVCECGFPVWNTRWSVSAPLLIQLIHKERTWRLTQNKKLYEEGMQHSAPIPDSCCAHTEWKRRRDDR